MSELFFRIIRHLLPTGRAWRLTVDKTLRRFFQGLSGVGADARAFVDDVYDDLHPQNTRALADWEDQFGLKPGGLTEQERRDRLDAAWKAVGGQDPRYIEDTLRAAGFDVYVHEWWVPGSSGPNPTKRDPNSVLGVTDVYVLCGEPGIEAGEPGVQCGAQTTSNGYLLTNRTLEPAGPGAPVPADSSKWPYILYIGGETFPDQASVPAGRRQELEFLALQICPAQQWLGMLINYT